MICRKCYPLKGNSGIDASAYFCGNYYRWLATQYQQRASKICESETGHQYERSLYDPYSEMICVRCHKNEGD